MISQNEQIAVENLYKKGYSPVIAKGDFCLQHIQNNTFATEVPLSFFTETRLFCVNDHSYPFETFLTDRQDEEMINKIITEAVSKNMTLNTANLRIDLVINKDNTFYAIEWDDLNTHYLKNGYFDLTHRNFSDFVKKTTLSKNENVKFISVCLFGDQKHKEKQIKQIINKILKGGF